MKTLKPVDVSDFYIRQIANGMAQYFWGYIFAPIFEILNDTTIENSKDDLLKAIKSGRIWYENGRFKTKDRFTNTVSETLEEMGARYVRGSFVIERNKLPIDIISTINITRIESIDKAIRVGDFLKTLMPLLETLSVRDFIEVVVTKMYKKLELDILKSAQEYKLPVIELGIVSPKVRVSKAEQKQIQAYWYNRDAEAEIIRKKIKTEKNPEIKEQLREKLRKHQIQTYQNAPTLDVDIEKFQLDKTSEKIASDYVYNMNYWIKKWEVKDITLMRKEVADMIQKGVRVPQLQEYFEKRWKIAKNKAKFLADNESRLASSVIQATQYQKLGCTHFRWGKSVSKEKRELHLELAKPVGNQYGINGTNIFSFNNPPIIDDKLGIKGLPRQIWNCKCRMFCIPPKFEEAIQKAEEIRNSKKNVIEQIKYKIRNSKQRSNNNWKYRQFGQRKTF